MINVLDKWEVGGASCSAGSTRPWPSARIRPRLKLDIPLFAKRINHYSSMISQFSSDTAESSVCNGQLCQGGEFHSDASRHLLKSPLILNSLRSGGLKLRSLVAVTYTLRRKTTLVQVRKTMRQHFSRRKFISGVVGARTVA